MIMSYELVFKRNEPASTRRDLIQGVIERYGWKMPRVLLLNDTRKEGMLMDQTTTDEELLRTDRVSLNESPYAHQSTPKPTNAPLYANLFASMVPIAREHGYALAVHGSVKRDLDLIAVPWVEAPSAPEALVQAFTTAFYFDHVDEPEQKLHGRLCWTLAFPGECFVDLSVMPAKAPEPVWPPAF